MNRQPIGTLIGECHEVIGPHWQVTKLQAAEVVLERFDGNITLRAHAETGEQDLRGTGGIVGFEHQHGLSRSGGKWIESDRYVQMLAGLNHRLAGDDIAGEFPERVEPVADDAGPVARYLR